jgi:hypothetical protein
MAALKEAPYRRKYAISGTAAETLRSLTKKSRFHTLELNELKNEIDAAVVESVSLKDYETIIDSVQDGEPVEALLVPLPDKAVGKGLWAVVHTDKFHKPGTPTQVVLSIQTTSQVEFNRQNGKWRTQHEPGKPMQSLGAKLPQEKLQAMRDAATAAAQPAVAPTPLAPSPVAAAMARVEEKASFLRVTTTPKYKLTWEEDGEGMAKVFDSKEELMTFMEALVAEGGTEDLKVFKEALEIIWVPMKTKVKIDLE